MAPTTPSVEPIQATAGDDWRWTHRSSTYPISEGWGLSYFIRGPGSIAWQSGYVTDDGATWTVAIPATATKNLPAGRYEFGRRYTGSGTYAGRVVTVVVAPLVVLPNLELAAAGDRVHHAEAMLAAIEAVLVSIVTGSLAAYQIGSRTFTKLNLIELRQLRAEYRAEVWKLRNPGKALPGFEVAFPGAGGGIEALKSALGGEWR